MIASQLRRVFRTLGVAHMPSDPTAETDSDRSVPGQAWPGFVATGAAYGVSLTALD